MSRRWQIAGVLDKLGVTAGLLRLRARGPSPWLPVFTYHRVHPNPDDNPFDDGVVDATPDEFDRQMAIVSRSFNPLGIDQLCDWADGRPLPPNPVAITFDDGYLDNHQHALPILQRHGVRATFFIATTYISERRLFWWDRICYLVKHARGDTLTLGYPAPYRGDLANDRRGVLRYVLRLVKDQFDLDLPRLLDELTAASGLPWSDAIERAHADRMLMTWDHVRALRAAGMDVQSHTRTHRVLHTLPHARLQDELAGSKADLERELGEPVRAVSYPIGKRIHERPAIRDAVRDAGYAIGFSNATGVNHLWGKLDRYDVHRLAMDRGLPDAYFRGILAFPYLAA
jgi:peptidoglycan/xylan/chitin deacetylase (PgdA/CDA1 family)